MKYNIRYVQRFWEKVEKTDGCWLWLGYCNPKGYGYYYDGYGTNRVHRFAYRVLVGEIPDDLEIDHLCRVRNCVNPKHLETVTHRVNCRRGVGSKTHCAQGHEFTPDNTRTYRQRTCIACVRARNTRYRLVGRVERWA